MSLYKTTQHLEVLTASTFVLLMSELPAKQRGLQWYGVVGGGPCIQKPRKP
jgi:hypothetical protein